MCKIDLQNCYCNICLPRKWHSIFTVDVAKTQYKCTRLPFGWKYSPTNCQTLIRKLVTSTLRKTTSAKVGSKVYQMMCYLMRLNAVC